MNFASDQYLAWGKECTQPISEQLFVISMHGVSSFVELHTKYKHNKFVFSFHFLQVEAKDLQLF